MGFNTFTNKGLTFLIDCMTSSTLEAIHFSQNKNLTDEAAECIAKAIVENVNIRRISLSATSITDAGAIALAQAVVESCNVRGLTANKMLDSISLTNNLGVTQRGADAAHDILMMSPLAKSDEDAKKRLSAIFDFRGCNIKRIPGKVESNSDFNSSIDSLKPGNHGNWVDK